MLTISVGQTIRTTDAWLTAIPDEGWTTYSIREGDSMMVAFELVVVNERGVESKPATVGVFLYHTDDGPGGPGGGIQDDGPGGPIGKYDGSETPPIIVQPESM